MPVQAHVFFVVEAAAAAHGERAKLSSAGVAAGSSDLSKFRMPIQSVLSAARLGSILK
jgi:hypothetical protein